MEYTNKTPISDKNNCTLKSSKFDLRQWVYDIGLRSDDIIPIQGYTNPQRIELYIEKLEQTIIKLSDTWRKDEPFPIQEFDFLKKLLEKLVKRHGQVPTDTRSQRVLIRENELTQEGW